MTTKEIASVVVTTNDGKELQISRIENRIAYDQDNQPIPDRSFRHNPSILDNNWVRPKELVAN
jgi:hypothetical protein